MLAAMALLCPMTLCFGTARSDEVYALRMNPNTGEEVRARAGEVLVRFDEGATLQDQQEAAGAVGGAFDPSEQTKGLYTIALAPGADPFYATEVLLALPQVSRAMPNVAGRFAALPTDPGLQNWWFKDRDALADYYAAYQGDERCIVVVMDTGIYPGHQEFQSRIATGVDSGKKIYLGPGTAWNFTGSGGGPIDDDGHGTSMSGFIGAVHNNGEGIAGLAHQNPMWVFKVGSATQDGPLVDFADFVTALDTLIDLVEGATSDLRYVVNVSLGWPLAELDTIDPSAVHELHDRIASLDATGKVLIVAATGNQWDVMDKPDVAGCAADNEDADMSVAYPAAFSGDAMFPSYESVVAVGAYRMVALACSGEAENCPCECDGSQDDLVGRAEFSRYAPPHPNLQSECVPIVDLLAPGGKMQHAGADASCDGGNIYGLDIGSPTATKWSIGTSAAAAITSAVAAGAWSRNLNEPPGKIKALLKRAANREGAQILENVAADPLRYWDYDVCMDTSVDCDPGSDNPEGGGDCVAKVLNVDSAPQGVFERSHQVGSGFMHPLHTLESVDVEEFDEAVYVTQGVLTESRAVQANRVIIPAGVRVGSGVTLTLGTSGGAEQYVLVDTQGGGREIIVDGSLQFDGDVTFQAARHGSQTGDWGGIHLTSEGTMVSEHRIRIRDAETALFSVSGADVEITSLVVESAGAGVWFEGTGSLEVSEFHVSAVSGTAFRASGGGNLLLGEGQVSSTDGAAVILDGGTLTMTGPCLIDGTGGMFIWDAPDGSEVANLTMTDCVGSPLSYAGGDLSLGPNIQIDGTGPVHCGIDISGPGVVTPIGSIAVERAGLHGIALYGAQSTGQWEVTARLCGDDGMHVESASMSLGATSVLSENGGSGLWVDGGSVVVSGASLNENGQAGIQVVGTSLSVHNSAVRGNLLGVFANVLHDPDLGLHSGGNDFRDNVDKIIVNLRPGTTAFALGNLWNRCPPKSSRFVGDVIYDDESSCIMAP